MSSEVDSSSRNGSENPLLINTPSRSEATTGFSGGGDVESGLRPSPPRAQTCHGALAFFKRVACFTTPEPQVTPRTPLLEPRVTHSTHPTDPQVTLDTALPETQDPPRTHPTEPQVTLGTALPETQDPPRTHSPEPQVTLDTATPEPQVTSRCARVKASFTRFFGRFFTPLPVTQVPPPTPSNEPQVTSRCARVKASFTSFFGRFFTAQALAPGGETWQKFVATCHENFKWMLGILFLFIPAGILKPEENPSPSTMTSNLLKLVSDVQSKCVVIILPTLLAYVIFHLGSFIFRKRNWIIFVQCLSLVAGLAMGVEALLFAGSGVSNFLLWVCGTVVVSVVVLLICKVAEACRD